MSINHVAIVKALKRDADLREEVSKARYQAQIEPLSKIIRESRHNWKAATWLRNYLSKHELPAEVMPETEQESEE